LRQIESFHRRQLRSVLNVSYPRRISNQDLYSVCEERPLLHRITKARWGLFGHILRRPRNIPAYLHMEACCTSTGTKWRGRPRTTLPVVLDQDLSPADLAIDFERMKIWTESGCLPKTNENGRLS
ncbi:hypothetical protein F442_18146, partial [Phytophthora nicotianae P10297]